EDDLDALIENEQEQSPTSDELTPDKDSIPLNEEDDDIDAVIEQEQTEQTGSTTPSDQDTDPLPKQDDLNAALKLNMATLHEQDDDLRTQENRQLSEVKAEALEETVQPDIQRLAQQDLAERRDKLQLFDEESAKSILHLSKPSLKPTGPRTDVQPPAHTTIQRYKMIQKSEGRNDAAQLVLYVEGSTSNSESVRKFTDQFSERLEASLTAHIKEHESLKGISDSTVINMIYAALSSPGESSLEQAADFRIFLGINNSYWILNRRDSGDMRTLCIPHENPEVREIHADNTDPTIAANLAKAIYKSDQVEKEQLEQTKRLPAISKLPPFEDGGYYLLMERTALNELMTEQDILKFIKDRKGQDPQTVSNELKQELTGRCQGIPDDGRQ
ncbi:hypothetical protein CAPTEDRAFT_185336, partial [Capitella teleta]